MIVRKVEMIGLVFLHDLHGQIVAPGRYAGSGTAG